jgi:hypothetical protein
MNKFFSKIVIALFCVLLVSAGCTKPDNEGFAIYLTRDDVPPSQIEPLSHVEIADSPVISEKDIVYYNARLHALKLTRSAFDRISKLDVPVRGKSFVVCVDKSPVYWGAFWTPISSLSFNGITIWKPLLPDEPAVITLRLGYPGPSFSGGGDPRSNPAVLKSLEQAGKLTYKLTLQDISALPQSMKGYELYSWLENGQWQFTLITGTNRNKTLEELTSEEDTVSETDWVIIHVSGVEAIEAVLGKIPSGQSVFWMSGLREPDGNTKIQLPPGQTVEAIKEFALQGGLDFHVQTP